MSTNSRDVSHLALDIDGNDNIVEFEAPSSAMSPPQVHNYKPVSANTNRPFSIDLSLALERQLELESPPVTPADFPSPTTAHPDKSMPDRQSLDPHILAHIVMQLRQNLAEMTKERDDLLQLMSSVHTKEAELRDALQLMTDKATGMEEELSESRRKIRDDEEAIKLLRIKVEESRRGLMRLQTESRRQSGAPPSALDLSRSGLPFTSPNSNKRASFTPLTGSSSARSNAHKRVSSVSDSGVTLDNGLSTSPNSQILTLPDSFVSPKSARRASGFFGGRNGSPPQLDPLVLQDIETEQLRKELKATKEAMEELRHELTEATEAREASETCAQALRDFIAESHTTDDGNDSLKLKLPPLPASTTGEEADSDAKSTVGWGFKLWKVDTAVKAASGPNSASLPMPPPMSISTTAPASAAPFARKIGGFFSGRGSISSGSPITPVAATTVRSKRDSMYSSSDVSSLAEPVSPEGNGPQDFNVMVRDVSDSRDTSPNGKGDVFQTETTRVVLG
ncbi:hypothetical protein C8J56DRAFT_788983 [Mycena floridula]|nr:hypothetical protein C8J56DRAFT_788983 [Mycena floridula]